MSTDKELFVQSNFIMSLFIAIAILIISVLNLCLWGKDIENVVAMMCVWALDKKKHKTPQRKQVLGPS